MYTLVLNFQPFTNIKFCVEPSQIAIADRKGYKGMITKTKPSRMKCTVPWKSRKY